MFSRAPITITPKAVLLQEMSLSRGVGSPRGNNCLIDSIRQCLSESHMEPCDLSWMRKELQKQFSDVLAKNYLDLRRHGQAILKLFSCDPNDFTIICLSNDLSRIADVVGQGQHRLFVLNSRVADVVGEGHFDPLFLTMSTEQEPDGPQQEQPALEALPRALEQQADSEALPSLQEQQPPPEGLPIAHQQPASEKPSAQRKQPTPVMQPKPDNSAHSASDVNTLL